MSKELFRILLQQSNYRICQPIITDTWTAWETGKLRDVREVEVCLLADPRVSRSGLVLLSHFH